MICIVFYLNGFLQATLLSSSRGFSNRHMNSIYFLSLAVYVSFLKNLLLDLKKRVVFLLFLVTLTPR